jgi:hypothetical protein
MIVALAMDMAAAQDRAWKECELADHDPDRSIVACSKLLTRPSSRVHAELFITAAWRSRPKETWSKQFRILLKEFGSIRNAPIVGRSEESFTPARASTNKASLTSLKRSAKTQPLALSDFILARRLIEV